VERGTAASTMQGEGLKTTLAGRTRTMTAASRLLYPVAGLAVVLLAWWTVTTYLGVRPIILPAPQNVAAKLVEQASLLSDNAIITLAESLTGFLINVVVGIAAGALIAASSLVDRTVSPWLVALNAIPKVALAPLLVVWLGFGMSSRVGMVVLMCFFPIVLASATGLKSTPAELIELTKSLDAPKWRTFLKVRFPNALPHIFVGLKVAMPLAVVGAVIGEFRGNGGLGQVIVRSSALADTELAFAAIFVVSILSILLYYLLVAVERLLLPWVRATTS